MRNEPRVRPVMLLALAVLTLAARPAAAVDALAAGSRTAWTAAPAVPAGGTDAGSAGGAPAAAPPAGSIFAPAPAAEADGPLALSFGHRAARTKGTRGPQAAGTEVLGSERARILLRSLTLPGWGQATSGHRGSAVFFGLTETAIWGSFTAFRIQVAMREDAFLRTARLDAGIDLRGRDEEWRRIVGSFISSDEYNVLVVARDAANLYYDDPAAYRAYLAAHSLKGADAWSWSSAADQERYRGQRKNAQRAAQRANTTLAVAVVNRIVSALHAARFAGRAAPAAHAWQLEVVPVAGDDATAFQFRVHARF